jgi:hypothetical protein
MKKIKKVFELEGLNKETPSGKHENGLTQFLLQITSVSAMAIVSLKKKAPLSTETSETNMILNGVTTRKTEDQYLSIPILSTLRIKF